MVGTCYSLGSQWVSFWVSERGILPSGAQSSHSPSLARLQGRGSLEKSTRLVFQIKAHLIPFAHLLGFCQETNHLNNLNLSALICRMGIITILRFSFFKKKKDFIYLFILERGRGREKGRETSEWERNIDWLPSAHAPTGDRTRNPGTCPDWKLNLRHFALRDDIQPTEAHWPGPIFKIFMWIT